MEIKFEDINVYVARWCYLTKLIWLKIKISIQVVSFWFSNLASYAIKPLFSR